MSVALLRWLAAVLVLANLAWYWYWDSSVAVKPVGQAAVSGIPQLVLLEDRALIGESALDSNESSPTSVSQNSTWVPGESMLAKTVLAESALVDSLRVESNRIPLPLRCWELGPLDDEMQAALAGLYELSAVPMRTFERPQVVATDYWVYIPAQDTVQRQSYQRRLDAIGVESYIVVGAELDGSLSLGLFSSLERAETVARPLQTRGLPVQIFHRQRTASQVWLSLDSREVAALGWPKDVHDLPLQTQPDLVARECDSAAR